MKIAFVILIFFSSLQMHAQEDALMEQLYESLSRHEKKDYDFVVQTCHADITALATLVDSTKNDSLEYFQYLFPAVYPIPTRDNISTRGGLGKNTHRLLNSSGYYLGLRACFPNSETKRHLYTLNLLLFDAYGKAATISIMAASGAGLYKGFAYLGRRIAIPPTVALFKKLNASEKFLSQLPRYMGKVGIYAFNGITVANAAVYVYQTNKDKELMEGSASKDSESVRQSLQRNLDLYHQTLELHSQAKYSVEREAMEALEKEQKEIILFYVDTLLKQDNLGKLEKENLATLRQTITST